MEACDYEQDLLCDLPTPDLSQWRHQTRSGCGGATSSFTDSVARSLTTTSDDSGAGGVGSGTSKEIRRGGYESSGGLPRVATPIPMTTMRQTYLETVRQFIDEDIDTPTTTTTSNMAAAAAAAAGRRRLRRARARGGPLHHDATKRSLPQRRRRFSMGYAPYRRVRSPSSPMSTSQRLVKSGRAIADGFAKAFRRR